MQGNAPSNRWGDRGSGTLDVLEFWVSGTGWSDDDDDDDDVALNSEGSRTPPEQKVAKIAERTRRTGNSSTWIRAGGLSAAIGLRVRMSYMGSP